MVLKTSKIGAMIIYEIIMQTNISTVGYTTPIDGLDKVLYLFHFCLGVVSRILPMNFDKIRFATCKS